MNDEERILAGLNEANIGNKKVVLHIKVTQL